MTSKKVSDESAAGTLDGSELVRVVQGGASVRTTAGAIAALGGFGYLAVTADATLPAENTILDVDTSSVTAPGTLTLTLPAPVAGRLYLVRKVEGDADETITLARYASEEIDAVASSRLMTGTDQAIDSGSAGPVPFTGCLVWSDGTDWWTFPIGAAVRHVIGPSAPVDGTHHFATDQSYIPGSTWADTSTSRLYVMMAQVGLSTASWHRIDAVDVLAISSTSETLPSKDRYVFVDTATLGGNVTLTLPSPTGRNAGRTFVITRTNSSGTNKITLARAASESINGVAASFDLPGSATAAYGRWHVV